MNILQDKTDKTTQDLQDAQGIWSDETFGVHSNPRGALHHMAEEIMELMDELDKVAAANIYSEEGHNALLYEWADVWTLMLDAARRSGLSVQDLNTVGFSKLEINKKRRWNEEDKNGVIRHIKE